jgi:hypothetical protein
VVVFALFIGYCLYAKPVFCEQEFVDSRLYGVVKILCVTSSSFRRHGFTTSYMYFFFTVFISLFLLCTLIG